MTTTTTRRTCDCDHGEPQTGLCSAEAVKRHRHRSWSPKIRYLYWDVWLRLCDPCNTECHNRENERWA